MDQRTSLVALAACAVTTAVVLQLLTSRNQLVAEIHGHSGPDPQTSSLVPDHIVYGFLFRNVTENAERNLELQAKGAVTKKYLAFKRELGFTAEQSRLVIQIATECEFQVKRQDKNAQLLIAQFRSKLPKTKEAPPPPPELKTMWDERNATILAARDRLRIALGSETFERLDNFARYRYGTNKAPVSLRPVGRDPNKE